MDLKKYVDRRKFSVFVMVSELLDRAEERRDGTEKDFFEVLERWARKEMRDSYFVCMAVST